jgi:hypothetical protein
LITLALQFTLLVRYFEAITAVIASVNCYVKG